VGRLDKVTVTDDQSCVQSGSSTTFTFTIANTGTGTLNSLSVTDSFGPVSGVPSSLAAGKSVTLTRTAVITTAATSFEDVVTVTAVDAFSGTSVSASGSATVHVVHPSATLVKSADATTVLPGTSVTFS